MSYGPHYHNCKSCGKEFTSKKITSLYCSNICRSIGHRRPLTKCKVCGKEFKGQGKTPTFCSRQCRGITLRANNPDHQCIICLRRFTPTKKQRHRLTKGGYAFCSRECSHKAHSFTIHRIYFKKSEEEKLLSSRTAEVKYRLKKIIGAIPPIELVEVAVLQTNIECLLRDRKKGREKNE